jgi:hypothetical protein
MYGHLKSATFRKEMITQRLASRAAELWGVENPAGIDPLVRLLLDVVAFEIEDLASETQRQHGASLRDIAQSLIPGPWLMPRPDHAVMRAEPLALRDTLGSEDQFYIPIREKNASGIETVTDLYFSPLARTNLVAAKVAFLWNGQELLQQSERGEWYPVTGTSGHLPDQNDIWIALDIHPELLQIDELQVYLEMPADSEPLLQLRSRIEWQDHKGQALVASPFLPEGAMGETDRYDGRTFAQIRPQVSILEDIAAVYRHRILTLRGANGPFGIARTTVPEPVKPLFSAVDPELLMEKRLWLRLSFPPAMGADILRKTRLYTNCFPILCRKLHQKRQRVQGDPAIIPLQFPGNERLMAVESVVDENGNPLAPHSPGIPDRAEKSYFLHRGHLERFDRTTAGDMITKMLRLLREEANIFAVHGQEIMLKLINNLKNDLEAIQKHLGNEGMSKIRNRYYLILKGNTPQVEVSYWTVSDLESKRRLKRGDSLLQYKQISIKPGSARLQTDLIPGSSASENEEVVQALRYALLTRERISSRQDIRQFVFRHLGKWISKVDIRNAVAISSDRKRGLVRMLEVVLTPVQNAPLNTDQWSFLLSGLTESLNRRSVSSLEYKIVLKPEATI